MIIQNQNLNIKTSIFYINDYHGKAINMERTMTAANGFDSSHKNNKTEVDTFKLSSGDIQLGDNYQTNQLAVMFQNMLGITASAAGNHEYDMQANADSVLKLIKYKLLANNVNIKPGNPFSKQITKNSIIAERNGHKYGIIGASPLDLHQRSKDGIVQTEVQVLPPKEALNSIQKEVDKLEAQGINKIILLSHMGYTIDKIVAQQTKGIDVILGGHSHDLVEGIKEGENLQYSKIGEPVVITQGGRDGKNFGILNIEFDPKGVIKKVQNNIAYTRNFPRYAPTKYVFDKIFGEQKILGSIKAAPPPLHNDLIEPNGHAYFITDCVRKDLDCDIALLAAAHIRGYFEAGKIDTRTIYDILPFKTHLYRVNYSEKDIVDAFKVAAKSFVNISNKPGIFYASGLKYTVSDKGNLLSMSFVDKTGKETPININNPRTDKFYTTVLNEYCAQGNDGFKTLYKPDKTLKIYDFSAAKCVENILLSQKEPVEIKTDDRIKIVHE